MSDNGPTQSPVNIYAIFHLNLAFSSIDESSHKDVIDRCYWPLLNIIEQQHIPLGIELTAYTLECIVAKDDAWITKFRQLLGAGKCELLASGDSQIIGPLIPAEVNQKNLQLGQQSYQQILGIEPKIAYVNEQAISLGLLDIYREAGFEAVIVEWDNPYSHNPDWPEEKLGRPQSLTTASGNTIKVIWNNAIAFQKFQRYAHGETALDDYLDYLESSTNAPIQCFSIYGSDAEVFDFRPGRYQTEAGNTSAEWSRLVDMMVSLKKDRLYTWVLPHESLSNWQDEEPLKIATNAHPISVKKQAKYNITRWGLSGKNDLLLNTHCFHRYHALKSDANDSDWRDLCRLWASDLRTHLTPTRYDQLSERLSLPTLSDEDFRTNKSSLKTFRVEEDETRHKLKISSDVIELTLNTYRGLAIEALAFKEHEFVPVIGTLSHGHFKHIRYGADFYSNHMVMERFKERDRVADLNKTAFDLVEQDGMLIIQTRIITKQGALNKRYTIEGQRVRCSFSFDNSDRPEASLRLGFVTLLNDKDRPWFACHNGGVLREAFHVDTDMDHGSPVSSIVSANSALGATTGEFLFGNNTLGVRLEWNPSECAALPMVSSKKIDDQYLNRCWFSLIEADETLKPGGTLPPFTYNITPIHSEEISRVHNG